MRAYVINLDNATERWKFIQQHYSKTGITVTRVSAVEGKKLSLPIPEYDPAGLKRYHGQLTNLSATGCYLSHLKCMQLFLDSKDPYAIIAEDDGRPIPELRTVVDSALVYGSCWDILRLCGFHDPHPVPYASLAEPYRLAVCFTRLCGTGAYVLNRHAAEVLMEKLVPMWLPIDHALDREWSYGLRASVVIPLPYSQVDHGFSSQIAESVDYKLPWYRRYWTVFPYRTLNESQRIYHRFLQLRRARSLARRLKMHAAESIRFREAA